MRLLLLVLSLASWALVLGCAPSTSRAHEQSQAEFAKQIVVGPEDILPLPTREPFSSKHIPFVVGWSLRIPSINVSAEISAVGLEPAGGMQAPAGPEEVGWYRYGPYPGERGNMLLAGHVDWTDRQTGLPRTGVFWDLSRVPIGSEIIVSDGTRDHVYKVAEKHSFAASDPASVSVLRPTSEARVTLITCGGEFDPASRNYSMREVVIAYRVG